MTRLLRLAGLATLLLTLSLPALAADWAGWSHSPTVAVHNNAATALPTGYTVQMVLDTASLVGQGLLRSDCNDLRVSYVSGGNDVELDRLVEGGNTAATTVTFRTPAAISLAGSDTNYRLHYGYASAGSPPADASNVFAFYDDFQDGNATGWTTKGTWGVVADGGNYVYRYTTGGANWALAYAPMTGLTDIDYVAKVRAVASTSWIGLAFRIQDTSNFLTFYQSRDVSLFKYGRIAADNHTIPATAGFTMDAGTWYRLRVQAIGNQLRGRIWLDGSAEPTTWQLTQTDATYHTASSVGATLYNHTTSADWDDFKVRRLVSAEPTVTMLASEYTLTVNTLGSGSVDKSPDKGTYEFGDEIMLTATAAEGWTFAGWSDGLTGNPTTVTIQANTTVTARFAMNVAPWWNSAWGYRARVTVTNTSTTEMLGVGYSARVTVDIASLIASGRVRGDFGDLRVVSFDGITNAEVDRVIENAGTDQTDVWFALPRSVGPSGLDDGFYLYYGSPSAGSPPANGSSVFMFYEDWEQEVTHWTNAGGFDGGNSGTLGTTLISTLEAVSATHSQQFPQKVGGGDAFSGFIPVTAGAGYAIGVWGKSATNAYVPVGLDPYSSAYVKGTENWLWTNEWTVGAEWSQHSGRFTAAAGTAFIKIKSEWWLEGPGTAPVYLDNLYLRHSVASEPSATVGDEESTLSVPTIANIGDTGPVEIGALVTVAADVATTDGTIEEVTLRLQSPQVVDIAMSLLTGGPTSGRWQAVITPTQGGSYGYRILAHASTGLSTLSSARTFTVTDLQAPQIALVSILNPILVKNTQTLTVTVTDNGQVGAVAVNVGGTSYAMSRQGNQYTYAWRVSAVGTISYLVTATDTGGNQANLSGSFESNAREVDVSTWLGGKAGAASWSIDDGNSSCLAELTSYGLRGTYFYNGTGSPEWLTTYSAAGHEIGSHSVGHSCDTPSCSPNCTPQGLWELPFTPDQVTAYRQDQLDPNVAGIEAAIGKPVVTMAWPCGCVDARRMTAAAPYFLGVRGYYDYIAQLLWVQDVNEATPAEFMNLNSSNSYNQLHVDRAVAEGKWAVITSHGSCDGISYIASLQNVLWVAPIGEVLKYIKVRDAAQFSNYSRVGRTIAFDAVHNLATMSRQRVNALPLSPIVFDNAVTLKVHILDTDTVLDVQVNGVAASYAVVTLDGTRYVTFDAALNASRHVVVTLSKPMPVIDQVSDDGPIEPGSPVRVAARVTVAEGPVQNVTLHVTAPEAAAYGMTLVSGTTDTYAVSYTPDRIASYTCYVSAANDEGSTNQSTQHAFLVRDTTAPQWRALAQANDTVPVGEANTLSAEGIDPGGLQWAVLATDESGTWQEFNWSGSDWWSHQWTRRRAVTIHETAGLARSSETIDLPVSSEEFVGLAGGAAELRVADTDRHEVPCQVYGEQSSGGIVTCRLVFQADVDANAERTYYIYYGNPAATPPAYSTDLTSSTAGSALMVRNTFLSLDLDTGSGVVSRLQLPTGTNTNLPLATQANAYWGWHQVCSSVDGNITGKNTLCAGGTTPATGLVLTTLIDGPVVKVFEFTSQKGAATYRMTYRFFANAPYYQYELARTGTTATVLNNFWYANGNYTRIGGGSDGAPSGVYNTYGNGVDQVRIAGFAATDIGSIDGTDNDGTQMGATDYRFPTATGLSLCVATGSTQLATQEVVVRRAEPVGTELGVVESAPVGQYGSPLDAGGATGWTPTAFTWQNASIADGGIVQWRISYCDLTGNCGTTDVKSFRVGTITASISTVDVGPVVGVITNPTPTVRIPVRITRNGAVIDLRGYKVTFSVSSPLALASGLGSITEGSYLGGGTRMTTFLTTARGSGVYEVTGAILGDPCGADSLAGTLFYVTVSSAETAGSGTVAISEVVLRDCGNQPMSAAIGTAGTVPVDRSSPAVAVVAPNGGEGETWTVGSLQTINWTAADNQGVPSNGINIDYSANNGTSWTSVATGEANDGTFTWTVPNAPTTQALVRVTAHDVNGNTGSDVSDAAFTIAYPPVGAVTGLTATQVRAGNAAGSTTGVTLTWTAPPGDPTVEVWRKGFGRYPEYDDSVGVAVPTASATYLLPGVGPGVGWTKTAVTVSGGNDLWGVRGFYYYVAYVKDVYGTWSSASTVTGGTLNYHLGDVSNGSRPITGDNRVFLEDISLLGAHYGVTLSEGDTLGSLDVGPTSDGWIDGRPLTDNRVEFEDLVMFGLNYTAVSKASPRPAAATSDALVLEVPALVQAGETVEARVRMRGTGQVFGLSVALAWDPAKVTPVSATSGDLASANGAVVLSPRPGMVDATALGTAGGGITGDGCLAVLRFRAVVAGAPGITVEAVKARDGRNQGVTLSFTNTTGPSETVRPALTQLAPPQPNPFSRTSTISFSLAEAGAVDVAVYAVSGARVRTLARGAHEPGVYSLIWDGRDDGNAVTAAGVYYVRLTTARGQFSRRIVCIR